MYEFSNYLLNAGYAIQMNLSDTTLVAAYVVSNFKTIKYGIAKVANDMFVDGRELEYVLILTGQRFEICDYIHSYVQLSKPGEDYELHKDSAFFNTYNSSIRVHLRGTKSNEDRRVWK